MHIKNTSELNNFDDSPNTILYTITFIYYDPVFRNIQSETFRDIHFDRMLDDIRIFIGSDSENSLMQVWIAESSSKYEDQKNSSSQIKNEVYAFMKKHHNYLWTNIKRELRGLSFNDTLKDFIKEVDADNLDTVFVSNTHLSRSWRRVVIGLTSSIIAGSIPFNSSSDRFNLLKKFIALYIAERQIENIPLNTNESVSSDLYNRFKDKPDQTDFVANFLRNLKPKKWLMDNETVPLGNIVSYIESKNILSDNSLIFLHNKENDRTVVYFIKGFILDEHDEIMYYYKYIEHGLTFFTDPDDFLYSADFQQHISNQLKGKETDKVQVWVATSNMQDDKQYEISRRLDNNRKLAELLTKHHGYLATNIKRDIRAQVSNNYALDFSKYMSAGPPKAHNLGYYAREWYKTQSKISDMIENYELSFITSRNRKKVLDTFIKIYVNSVTEFV